LIYVGEGMTKPRRKYSRPNGYVEKIYPIALTETSDDGKSLLSGTKTLGFSMGSGEAAKLAVALMNAVSLMSKEYKSVDLTITIASRMFAVTVG
jgi:hypothetical protein